MTVYIVQQTMRKRGGEFVPAFDLTPARKYGDLEYVLPYGVHATHPAMMLRTIRHALRNFKDEDYILMLGDPIACGVATCIAANNNRGRFRALRWDKIARAYDSIEVDLHNGH